MFNDIIIFIQVVETGSFTKAALKLNTTQATVSRRIKELETTLGGALVIRDTRTLDITPLGMDLYHKLKDSELHIKNVIDEIKNQSSGVSGRLRVMLPNVMAYNTISPHIPKFLRDNKGVTLEIFYSSGAIDLMKEPFDIAITPFLPKQQTLLIKKLASINLKLYCAPSYAKKYGIPKTIDELKDHMLIGATLQDYTTVDTVSLVNTITHQETKLSWHSRVFINSAIHGIAMAKSGEIIGSGWEVLVKDDLEAKTLVPVLPDYSLAEVSFYQIKRPNVKSALIDLFSDFIADCFKFTS